MLLLIVALVAQDPNVIYQNLSRPQKERIFLVYERELRARQNEDGAVQATSKASGMPGGTVRLVADELKRDPKLLKERHDREKGLYGKNAKKDKDKPPKPRRTSSGGSSSTRASRTPKATTTPKYSGDGITVIEGEEKVKFGSKEFLPFEFQQFCRYVQPEDVESVPEKDGVVIDVNVQTPAKDWLIAEVVDAEGNSYSPVLIFRIPSIDRIDTLHRGNSARLWGWFADQSQIDSAEKAAKDEDEDDDDDDESDEETRPGGRVFFAMEIDKASRPQSGLNFDCNVTNREENGTNAPLWDIEVTANNNGDRTLTDVEVEVNVVVEEAFKGIDDQDSTYVYFDAIEPGKSSTVTVTLPNWAKKQWDEALAKGTGRFSKVGINPAFGGTNVESEEEEEMEVTAVARCLGAKAGRK